MIDEVAMKEWLRVFTADRCPLSVPFETGPDISEYANADTAGTLTMLPGFGLAESGVFDVPQFEILIRAREHQLTDLQRTFQILDKALVQELEGEHLWGTWVAIVGRSGGQPTPRQQDTRERRAYVCTYFAKVEL